MHYARRGTVTEEMAFVAARVAGEVRWAVAPELAEPETRAAELGAGLSGKAAVLAGDDPVSSGGAPSRRRAGGKVT